MKKTRIALTLFALITTNLSISQPNDPMINSYWYFYSSNFLDAVSSGKGNTGIGSTGNISAIQLNPASMEIPGKYQADLQYTYKTNQPWLPGLDIGDLYLKQNIFSGSAGFGYRINKNFQVGFLYSNPKSMTLNVGEIITTNEFGEEINRYDAYDKYNIHSFSVPLVYSTEKLRLGLSVSYNLHRRYANFSNNNEVTGKVNLFNLQGGIIVKPLKELSIGVTFSPQISGDVTYDTPLFFYEEDYEVVIPMEFGAGIEYTFRGNFLKLSGDYTYTNSSIETYQKDLHKAHLGIEYLVDKNWTVRTGFFTSPDVRDLPGSYFNYNESYEQIFLTLGATLKLKKASLSLAVMDSHISSDDLKYTFINGGLTFDF